MGSSGDSPSRIATTSPTNKKWVVIPNGAEGEMRNLRINQRIFIYSFDCDYWDLTFPTSKYYAPISYKKCIKGSPGEKGVIISQEAYQYQFL